MQGKLNKRGWFILGVCAGVLLVLGILIVIGRTPEEYARSVRPLIDAGIITGTSPAALARALNPCVTSEQLPTGCEKYVHDGVVNQPPIKIVVSEAEKK